MVTAEQQKIIDRAQLQQVNGWQHLKVKGTPYECGFQEGYLLVDEYKDALRVYKFMTLESFGMTYEWFAEQALKLHRDMIPARWLEELRGMAEGLTAAGVPTTTDDMIAWNDWMEITGYWWPQNAGKVMSRPLMKTHRKEHCSAIVATGSATVDGKPYLGHESFDEFWSGQYFNVCKRVEPDEGYAFIMQASAPCMLSSMTDFYVTAAGLNITESTGESRELNLDARPKVIISASGMCDAGRIRHHLKHNLWRPESTILFVGYQAEGSLGRRILDGADHVKLFGEEIAVRARIVRFHGLSSHADRDGLVQWINLYTPKPQQVFVVHGEARAAENYAQTLTEMGFSAHAPNYEEVYDLLEDRMIAPGVVLEPKAAPVDPGSPAYRRLEDVGKKLMEVIAHNKGGSNKDLGKFADQLRALISKWDR